MADPALRVMFVATMLDRGGAERVTSTLLRHLDRSRFLPSLALLRHRIGYPVPRDVAVHHLGYRGLLTFPGTARRLRDLIDRERPQIVVGNVNATNLLVGAALRRGGTRPTWIARIGSSPAHHDRGLRGLAARRVYRGADLFVANSRGLAVAMADHYPFVRGRVRVVGNPTDFASIDRQAAEPAPTQRDPAAPLIVALGRLFWYKRYDVMLRALARVRESIPAVLWVCGDGPERGRLGRLASRLGVSDAVRWLGFQDNPYPLLKQADLFLLTSEYEGLPNALIEAQALGLPAVASRCDFGPDEIVQDGSTGLLVPVGDEEGTARALLSLLASPPTREAMALRAASRAREAFECTALVRRWEETLSRATPHGGTGSVRP